MRTIGGILTWGLFYAVAALAILLLFGEKRRADAPPTVEPPPVRETPVAAPEPAPAPPDGPPAPVSCQFGKRGGGDCAAEAPASPRRVRPVRIPRQ